MVLKLFLLLTFVLLGQSITVGQSSGLLCSDEKYKTLPLLPAYSGTKYNEIPLRYSMRKHCPVPGDQQEFGSCVGWALGYGALTIMRAGAMNITDPAEVTQMANSAAFIYNLIRQEDNDDCNKGAYIEDALILMKNNGDCLEKTFNYKNQDCRIRPEEEAIEEAQLYKITDYAAVFEIEEPARSKATKACKIIATGTPLVAGMQVTPSFWEIKPGMRQWDPSENESSSGFHAMVVIGYDNVEKQFELMNSFGTSWGRNGFIRMNYDDFERLCRYAFVLIPEFSSTEKKEKNSYSDFLYPKEHLSGQFVFRKPAGYLVTAEGQEVPFFEEVATRWDENSRFYTTQQPTFEVGDVFQLVAKEIPKGRYAYVLSQSPGESVTLHFPKTLASGKTAGFVLEKTAEIIIPNEETVLQLAEQGADYLCILYSYTAISNFEDRMSALQHGDSPLFQRVNQTFADIMIPASKVRMSEDKMAFQAIPDMEAGKTVVPLILKVIAVN